MINVAVDASMLAWPQGGIARYLQSVLPHMVEHDDLHFDLLTNSEQPVVGMGGITEIPTRVRTSVLWRNIAVTRYLRRTRPDVYWSPWLPSPLVVPVPLVITAHDLAPLRLRRSKPVLEGLAFRSTFRRTAARADAVLADSSATAEDLMCLWHVPPDRISVIPLGVDDRFTPSNRSEAFASVASRWGIDRPFILIVGTIEPRKGLGTIVDVAERLGGQSPLFVFAGRPGYRADAVLSRARATNSCRMLGHVKEGELLALYRAAEVLALPSLYEGFGLTALEAMACGTPVVAAARAGSVDGVFGAAAVLVEGRAAKDWVLAFERAMSERDALTRRGVVLSSRYRWSSTADQTSAVLRRVAGAGRTADPTEGGRGA